MFDPSLAVPFLALQEKDLELYHLLGPRTYHPQDPELHLETSEEQTVDGNAGGLPLRLPKLQDGLRISGDADIAKQLDGGGPDRCEKRVYREGEPPGV